MVAGQVMDINNENNTAMSISKLKTLHILKTGELIKASVLLGGYAATNATQEDLDQLKIFGKTLGLLYQVCDDILDVTADENVLGKQSGTDEALGKFTYINALGLDGAKDYAQELQQDCLEALNNTKGDSKHLITITNKVFQRI
jgi:farnesyl diphosphate synthase